ncbi:hypothetical protein QYE76_046832 [Lolium multiflorum]|uniref:Reverse transcriptase Ty1/copia-type domain-containing protein n=1 Tax=Lolium multiflorum TaxID=4521 RepID=A0AAD8WZJ5_LOLMU|nr:hypothetical protein QYE76_046832 [Lolium multiflorum]
MENYSLLMGDSSVGDGGGVDGGAFRGHFPVPAAPEQRLLSPRSWLRDGGGSKVFSGFVERDRVFAPEALIPEVVPVPPAPVTEEANDNDHETSNEIATEPRRSTRERATPDWYDPCLNVMIVDNNDEDPATYEEAMMSPDSNKWQEAMKSEMGSMYDNKVWTLVDLPDSRKAVENKWIFKRKTYADGNITVYKARLVAKGFRQIQGVDYDETFSPVAKLKSVRILLAIAAFFDYEIWQMDVKTAFLNGDIEEELYMVQPKGFVDPKNADKVCKLQRSIYGLKQASRSWNRRFDKVIKDFGFIQCHGEACIYKKVSGSSVAFLILYVDDILLIGNDIELLSSVKGYLNNSFSMKDLGEASYILGIKIYRDRSRRLIGLSQSTYLDKILKKFRMDESKKGFLPMLPGKVLSKTQGPATAEERERMNQIPYASAVGSIMYAMLCTRPDIAHAVSLTSRYQSDPGMEHWTAVKNILKYLKRTKDMFLCYGGDQELVVTSYTDASWNTDPDDSKSQSGYVFILNGAAVSWASSKQCTVAKSSTESEYIAASEASSEAVWMKRFIVELGVVPSALDPLVIYCDNMGAIANAQEPRSHKRLKHIKLRYHSIREYIEDGEPTHLATVDPVVPPPLPAATPAAGVWGNAGSRCVYSVGFVRTSIGGALEAVAWPVWCLVVALNPFDDVVLWSSAVERVTLPASAPPGAAGALSPAGFGATDPTFEDEEEGDVAWLVDDSGFRGRSSGTGAWRLLDRWGLSRHRRLRGMVDLQKGLVVIFFAFEDLSVILPS